MEVTVFRDRHGRRHIEEPEILKRSRSRRSTSSSSEAAEEEEPEVKDDRRRQASPETSRRRRVDASDDEDDEMSDEVRPFFFQFFAFIARFSPFSGTRTSTPASSIESERKT